MTAGLHLEAIAGVEAGDRVMLVDRRGELAHVWQAEPATATEPARLSAIWQRRGGNTVFTAERFDATAARLLRYPRK